MIHPRTLTETLVALDIDGTLLGYDGSVTDAVREALAEVRAAGAEVVLATGRGVVGVLHACEPLAFGSGWAVGSNGAVTARIDPELPDGFEVVEMITFDPEPAVRVLAAELPEALFAVEDLGRGFLVSGEFPDGELSGTQRVVGLDELVSAPATRVVLRAPERAPADFHALVERVGLHEVTYAIGWSAWMDLTPAGVTKASALESLRRRLGVQPFATVAVGDGHNDLEMLRWAARGVAMGHASDVVREAADEVTGTIEDDGVVDVLRSLLRAAG